MPIPTLPTTVDAPATTQITADALYVDSLLIATPDRAGKTTIKLVTTPYATATADRAEVYAVASDTTQSSDLFALASVVPEVGFAVRAVYVAVAAIRARVAANAAALIAAQTDLAACALAVQPAKDALDAAGAARTAAYAVRQSIVDSESPEWAAAHATLIAAEADYQTKLVAWNDAQPAVAAKAERVKIAQAAYADPANPPLATAEASA